MNSSSQPARPQPYWMAGGEHCGHCLHEYLYEAEVRCVACDGAVCPLCVVWVRREEAYYCPACHESAGTADNGPST